MGDAKIIHLPCQSRANKKRFFDRLRRPALRPILSILKQMLPIPSYLLDYTGPYLVTVSRLIEEKKYSEALHWSQKGLDMCEELGDARRRSRWWQFLSCAVYCAEVLGKEGEKERLLSLAETRREGDKGRDVAYCFSHFSRWKYAEGDYDTAIAYAEIARGADSSFAEAHFLLGWYTLFIREADPIEHFRAAIENDPQYLARLTRDPEIMNFPHLIRKLREPMLFRNAKG
jgi:tetratricopeptide (TPR) repeat protein